MNKGQELLKAYQPMGKLPKSSFGYESHNVYKGVPPFMDDARALVASWQPEAVTNNNLLQSTGIKTMKDIKGKRISTGSPGSATEVMALRLLEAAGLEKGRDFQSERLSVAESVNAIKDKKIDAFFWVGGLPTASVTDLANSPGNKLVMIDNDAEVAAMNKKYGNLYYTDVIPKSMYSGMAKDNKVSAVANMLVVSSAMPDDQAYKIVKAIFDNKKELVATHAEYENVLVKNQKAENSSVPFHPGAIKYLREQGVKF
jgi:TRAP transporter TAXI family solute receptor